MIRIIAIALLIACSSAAQAQSEPDPVALNPTVTPRERPRVGVKKVPVENIIIRRGWEGGQPIPQRSTPQQQFTK